MWIRDKTQIKLSVYNRNHISLIPLVTSPCTLNELTSKQYYFRMNDKLIQNFTAIVFFSLLNNNIPFHLNMKNYWFPWCNHISFKNRRWQRCSDLMFTCTTDVEYFLPHSSNTWMYEKCKAWNILSKTWAEKIFFLKIVGHETQILMAIQNWIQMTAYTIKCSIR